MNMRFLPACCLLLALPVSALADEEAANRPVVRSSQYGAIYARSVPDEGYGQKGRTTVFSVGKERDTVLNTYNWYANEIHIGGSGDRTLVRLGPWQRGRQANAAHLALGIYRDGKTIREYSTLEMQSLGSGLSSSTSHYTVFRKQLGFRWLSGNNFAYDVRGESGKRFTFDLDSGKIIPNPPVSPPPPGTAP
ncbi:MAG: hypothetical protein OER86_14460 [Phycisphaerae bacterium]|nr:hypothetical protein [Phycisphaerae bacterium]